MKIKYSPIYTNKNTEIKYISENKIQIDEEVYEFPEGGVTSETVIKQTNGAILEAFRDGGELYLTIRRFYTGSCTEWDDREYHDAEVFA